MILEPLNNLQSILEAIKQDPSLRVSLAEKYQGLGGTLINGSIPLPYEEEIPAGYTKTSEGVYQPTVFASANKNEKVIPELNEKVKNMSQTGSFVDSNGVERTADEKPVLEKDADAEFLKNLANFNRKFGRRDNDTTGIKKVAGGGIDTSNAFDEQGSVIGGTRKPTPQEEELDTTYNQNQALIDQMKTSLDASTKRQIDSIEKQFNIRRQQMEEINRRQGKGIEQSLLMGGSSRYAQLSSAGIVASQERDSLMKIAELDAQEKELVNAALSAQESGDFKLLEKKLDLAETKRKEKQTATEKLSKAIADENTKLREKKEKLDEVDRVRNIGDFVSDAVSSGITDVNEIYRQARLSGMKVNSKEISDSIKNLEIAEKIAPGAIGEWLSLKENAPEMKDLTFEGYLNLKDPTKALEIKERNLKIRELEKKIADEVPGGILDPNQKIIPTAKDARILNKELINTDAYKVIRKGQDSLQFLLDFEKAFDKYGLQTIPGKGRGELSTKYQTTLLNLKEFFNLGVLNGPDLEVLQGILPNPTKMPKIFGFVPLSKKLSGIKSKTEEGIKALKNNIEKTLDERYISLSAQYGDYSSESITTLKDLNRLYIDQKKSLNPKIQKLIDENTELSDEEIIQLIQK